MKSSVRAGLVLAVIVMGACDAPEMVVDGGAGDAGVELDASPELDAGPDAYVPVDGGPCRMLEAGETMLVQTSCGSCATVRMNDRGSYMYWSAVEGDCEPQPERVCCVPDHEICLHPDSVGGGVRCTPQQ